MCQTQYTANIPNERIAYIPAHYPPSLLREINDERPSLNDLHKPIIPPSLLRESNAERPSNSISSLSLPPSLPPSLPHLPN